SGSRIGPTEDRSGMITDLFSGSECRHAVVGAPAAGETGRLVWGLPGRRPGTEHRTIRRRAMLDRRVWVRAVAASAGAVLLGALAGTVIAQAPAQTPAQTP